MNTITVTNFHSEIAAVVLVGFLGPVFKLFLIVAMINFIFKHRRKPLLCLSTNMDEQQKII